MESTYYCITSIVYQSGERDKKNHQYIWISVGVARPLGYSSEAFARLLEIMGPLLETDCQVVSSRDMSRLCISTYFTELLTHLHASHAYIHRISYSYSYSWRHDTSTS